MKGRKWALGGVYRYGFNGKENDNEVKGEGNQQDYGMRIYDPRIGRFLSVDPLSPQYPWYTPYQFAGNKPIGATDLDGLEEKPSLLKQFIDAIGFPKLMQMHSDNVEEEAEFQQVEAFKQNGLKQVASDLKKLHDVQGEALSFAPGGGTLFSMLDYQAGIDKDPRNIVKAGATDLAFALGGSLFGKVGKVGGTLQDKFISSFNRISKRFGTTWGTMRQNGKFITLYLRD